MLVTYVNAVCKRQAKMSVADKIRKELRRMTKSMDSDNGRKVRPLVLLFFSSWAQKMISDGKLDDVLARDPWNIDALDRQRTLSKLEEVFNHLQNVAPPKTAKKFREKLQAHLLTMIKSTRYQKVWLH